VLADLWHRFVGRRRQAAVEHEAELEHMSPEERQFVEEGVKDHQAEEFVEEHLGGIDAERLLPDGPPAEDEPPDGRL
jgi:hypothetical protein